MDRSQGKKTVPGSAQSGSCMPWTFLSVSLLSHSPAFRLSFTGRQTFIISKFFWLSYGVGLAKMSADPPVFLLTGLLDSGIDKPLIKFVH